MMFQRKTNSLLNGNGRLTEEANEEPTRSWAKIRLNERTFSLSLFVLSLSIVLAKLYTNYGKVSSWQISDQHILPSVMTFAHMYNMISIRNMSILPKFDMKQLPVNSEKYLNISNQYAEEAASMLTIFYGRYEWFIRAVMIGIVITSFTWFIIYKDSTIPGVNPPSPFSPSRQRIQEGSRIQMNYLVGILNGILLFIYMCL